MAVYSLRIRVLKLRVALRRLRGFKSSRLGAIYPENP